MDSSELLEDFVLVMQGKKSIEDVKLLDAVAKELSGPIELVREFFDTLLKSAGAILGEDLEKFASLVPEVLKKFNEDGEATAGDIVDVFKKEGLKKPQVATNVLGGLLLNGVEGPWTFFAIAKGLVSIPDDKPEDTDE